MANAVLLGKNAKYGDWEPGTNQGNIWKMKQTSSLLIRTRTQGLLWRNHWNHQSGPGRVKMTTWIKGSREKLHNKSIMRELLESRGPFFRTPGLWGQLSSLCSSPANGTSQVPVHSSQIQTSTIWRQSPKREFIALSVLVGLLFPLTYHSKSSLIMRSLKNEFNIL